MKRLINFRYSVALPVSLALGVAICLMLANSCVLGGILLFLAIPVIGLTVGIIKKGQRFKVAVVSLVCMLFCVCGFLLMDARLSLASPKSVSGNAVVSARFTGVNEGEDRYVYSFDQATFTVDGEVCKNKRITVYSHCKKQLSFGDTVLFYGDVTSNPLYDEEGRINTYVLTSGISYTVNTDFTAFEKTGSSLGFFERIRVWLEGAIRDGMEEENAAVVIGMMFGDTSGINDHVMNGMRYAGIAHIFAVSGLHVGFVSALALGILRLLKLRRWPRCIVSVLVTAFYCGICGFSPSSVRALMMFTLLSVLSTAGLKYDLLGSIFLSFGVILAIRPQSIVDYGFVLSYSAVIAVAVFARPISALLGFMPSVLRSGVSVTLSAQLGIAPASMAFFGYMSSISSVINVFMIPVVSVYFMFTASCVILSAVFGAPWILYAGNLLTGLLVDFVSLIDFSRFEISGHATLWMIALFFMGMIASSDVVNLPFKVKLPLFTCVIAACIALSQLFVSGVL